MSKKRPLDKDVESIAIDLALSPNKKKQLSEVMDLEQLAKNIVSLRNGDTGYADVFDRCFSVS